MRTLSERQADTKHRLETDRDIWVASADSSGRPHLVPFSLHWDGSQVITTTPANSITARNIAHNGIARLALGDTRDVVILDVSVKTIPVAEVDSATSEAFNARTGWDPRQTSSPYVYFFMTPVTILAWLDEDELTGRTIMREGRWVD
jgi:hypothetical protein